ncbi:MAG: hypothetical protein ACI84R_003711 [Candidatus Azotimanducaceae bacterium]|jgi:hypothetical protein
MNDNISTERRLDSLTAATASDWRTVGNVLTSLEQNGRMAPDGDQWIHKVQEKLTDLGHKVSVGHLHKVRRAYGFLSSGMTRDGIPEKYAENAKISSIEIAERLYQLDPAAGSRALAACLDPEAPATAAAIKKQYDAFIEKHPEKKSAMHAAWDQRKKGDTPKSKPFEIQEHSGQDIMSNLQTYISSMEQNALKKDAHIDRLEEELGETNRLLAEAENELEIVIDELKQTKLERYRS